MIEAARWARGVAMLGMTGALILAAGSTYAVADALPGAEPLPQSLSRRLAAELGSRGASYVPRTRNLRSDGSPRFTNRLLLETSPYLEQHAHNPVNWYPWGDAAFADARRLDRPVLVSIGYSTCHWCHVMEEESFDDPELATYLNAHFIAIKVDREARPDVDAVYMAAIHALGQSGGWPLNVFVTPDRLPFYAGTYFPPVDRGGRAGFLSVLQSIVAAFGEQPGRIAEMSTRVSERVAQQLDGISATASILPSESVFKDANAGFTSRIDRVWGGIGRGTKFPSSVPIRLLLRLQPRIGDSETRRLVELTLEKMAAGGIHDHIAGGFHRYSTEPTWLVPHFEKMLYDNALIAKTYTEAYQATGRGDFERVARRTLDYVMAEMTALHGGFYSATDADSRTPSGESEEGWFFTWTPSEIESVLGTDDAAVVSAYFGITTRGNLDGRSILHVWRTHEEVAGEVGATPESVRRVVEGAIPKLHAARAKRPPPLRDEKIIAAWNGLMISAFARAGFVFAEPSYTQAAQRAASFALESMRLDGRLARIYKDGRAAGPAFLEDYAFLIDGLLELFEADSSPRWLREAVELQGVLDRHHRDDVGGGYFRVADDQEKLLVREKPSDDGAVPSGNSVAALNLVRLAELTSDPVHTANVVLLFSAFHETLSRSPTRLPEMLMALDMFLGQTKEVVLVRPESGGGGEAKMLAALRETYAPNRVVVVVSQGAESVRLAEIVPLVARKRAMGGRTTAYVCENRVCKSPTADPVVFAQQLRTGSVVPRP